jgi:tetratricopeptide (TPR) repeat protein
MTGPSRSFRRRGSLRAWARRAAFAFVLTALWFVAAARADQVKGEVKVSRENGFTRLAFRLDQEVPATVTLSNTILILTFDRPVDVAVDLLNAAAPDLISAARRDPDGSAIRIALAHPVKMHSIPAAERLFVDLLPENWTGVLPGAPQSVIDELAQRARESEDKLRARGLAQAPPPPIAARVKVAVQPTFTRFVFDVPEGIEAAPERSADKLVLRFNRQIRWDLADAKDALPNEILGIDSEMDFSSTRVTFALKPDASVRHFRDEHALVVDVDTPDAKPPPVPAIEAPQTIATDKPPETKPAEPAGKHAEAERKTAETELPAQNAPEKSAKPALAETAKPALAEAAKPAAAETAASQASPLPPPPAPDPNAAVRAAVQENGQVLRLGFTFAKATPAAVFRRADTLWVVFDTPQKIDAAALRHAPGIRAVSMSEGAEHETVLRLKLDRPRLVSALAEDTSWIVAIGDAQVQPPHPLSIARSVVGKGRANIVIPFVRASALHRLRDPEIGDRLMVITAPGPARAFVKDQHFVELRTLASSQGVVVQPIADDIEASIALDKITLSRPSGLSLSSPAAVPEAVVAAIKDSSFDPQVWGFDRSAPFIEREAQLIRAAAEAPQAKRWEPRLNLARFYLSRQMAVEAKGVLDVALSQQTDKDDITGSVLHAISDIMLRRPEQAMKALAAPQIGKQQDADLWRGIAFAQEGQWVEARQHFRNLEAALALLPLELQRMALVEAVRAAIEVHDYQGAAKLYNELETLGIPPELQPETAVIGGRLDEGLGHIQEALAKYRNAIASQDRRAAAQGRLHEIELRFKTADMPRKDAISALESLTTAWRGDHTEAEGLRLLAHLYIEAGRYREAFHVMKTAVLAHPKSDLTRKIQDEAAATFEKLFLSDKGDSLPPVEALGLFYDYRELTPIGRRGDEMIRKLADRLVAVDLLKQAAELLQHQVDHRLEGAARAQVAAKLAAVYLMNHQPDRALATLRATRDSDVSNELREHRLLLEARALSEIGRHGLALDLIASLDSHEAIRLRGDILWEAKRWREAAEQIELLYGERWREFKPLNDAERADILRAAIGYALGEEPIGLARLREKYAAKMAEGPDSRAFAVVTAPIGTGGGEFQSVARRIASVDTLAVFLRDIQKRFEPEAAKSARGAQPAPVANTNKQRGTPKPVSKETEKSAPAAPAAAPQPGQPPKPPAGGEPLRPDPMPTGSIGKPKTR